MMQITSKGRMQIIALAVAGVLPSFANADSTVTGPPLDTFQTTDNSKDITLSPAAGTFSANLSTYSSFISNVYAVVGYGSGTVGTADVMHQAGNVDTVFGEVPAPYFMVGRNANGEIGTVVYKFVLPSGDLTGPSASIDANVYLRGAPASMGDNTYIGVNGTIDISSNNVEINNIDDFSKLTMDSVFGGNPNYASYQQNDVTLAVPQGLNQFYVVVADDGSNARFALSTLNINGDVTVSAGGTPTWAVNASGDWNNGLNWSGGIPNGAGSIAVLGSAIHAPRTVFTDQAITLGALQFDSSSSYQVTGQGSLTISTPTGTGSISVSQGNHKINLPTYFASNTTISVASGASLNIANPMTIMANQTVTESGSVTISAPLTLQSGASLVVGSSAPLTVFGAPGLAAGAKVDVKTSSMSVDYRGLSDPALTIQSQLATSFAAGWSGSGIATSSATSRTGLGWKDDTSGQSILVKYTYYGDTDLSGVVDTADFTVLAAHFNSSGATWAQGDFNYDGIVNALDFNAIAQNFGQQAISNSAALGTLVPEPACISLLAIAGVSIVGRRRRGR